MLAALRRRPLLMILAAALTVRLVAALAVQSHLESSDRRFLLEGDAEGYWMLAEKIVTGEEYAVYDPPRRALRMPGLPILLAAVRVFTGESMLPVRIVLAAVGTAACGAVFLLGRSLDSERTGLIAAALAAFWPALIGFSVLVLSETLFALMLVLSLVAFARLVKLVKRTNNHTGHETASSSSDHPFSGVAAWSILSGVGVALATLVRPTWLPAALLFPLVFWLWSGRSRRAATAGLLVVVACAVTLAPWAIRNRIATGHWVLTTLWVGPSLYDGLNPEATGASDMRFFDEDRLLDRMSEYEMDREYRRRAWQYALDHPGRAVELAWAKLGRYWRPWPGAEQFSSPLAKITVAAWFLPMIVLAILGGWSRRRDLWLLGLTAAPILFFSLVHCVFVGSLRYRLPAEYPLCVLSAVGLQYGLQIRRQRRATSTP